MNKIALLKGGNGSEKDISLMTAEACKKAFKELGFKFVEIDIKNEFIQNLILEDIDTCFNALHGSLGENGSIPGLLNCLKIPYTHSGVQASCISINKSLTKYILSKQGIKFPKGLDLNIDKHIAPINYKGNYVVKPNYEGSSIGIQIVSKDSKDKVLSSLWKDTNSIIAEEYIEGKELTVGVLNGKSLCVTEIIAEDHKFYDYNSKYKKNGSKHILPASIPESIKKLAFEWSEKSFKFLNCRGIIRADFRYNEKNNDLFMLEINTHPGMTQTSLIPEQAEFCGITFNDLIKIILEGAKCD
ncbi:MAG: D-alanine--D-alanine ligase [SAR116 cluster bacterium]|nr:D-alanine--D-alanine ligase [SAR116 cluster bacterium]